MQLSVDDTREDPRGRDDRNVMNYGNFSIYVKYFTSQKHVLQSCILVAKEEVHGTMIENKEMAIRFPEKSLLYQYMVLCVCV